MGSIPILESQPSAQGSTTGIPSIHAKPTATATNEGSHMETSPAIGSNDCNAHDTTLAADRQNIRWEECLTDNKERYYHELATGRTQWELPTEGWVELIADDGARYYWDPATGTTKWTRPT